MANWQQIRESALEFQIRWADGADERAEAQIFLYEFLRVFGVDQRRVATFETKVHPDTDTIGYIDMLWPGRILVEMKSRGRSLDRAYAQARDYAFAIRSDADLPEFIMACDFERIRLYRQTTNQQWEFRTADLVDNVERFSILTDDARELDFVVDRELNTQAAYKMARLHDMLRDGRYTGHALELYLVRLLFCLFSDHSGIFNRRQFFQYVRNSAADGNDLSGRMIQLFDVLNTPIADRQPTLSPELHAFPYVNGGLFQEIIRPAAFDRRMHDLLLECCEFDWSDISPAIFGAMFQGVMDPEMRGILGAQYTPKNFIMDVIRPLFLDELHAELDRIGANRVLLEEFRRKIAALTFLDPACGCGNFLMVTYQELRLLELEVLRRIYPDVTRVPEGFSLENEICVNVGQFYGIEIEEFPGQIAQVGMWLMDQKMNNVAAREFGRPLLHLPLRVEAHIHHGHDHGNALQINWETVITANNLNFIIGNPPYAGARTMTSSQKQDLHRVAVDWARLGTLDYVSGWYIKAADMMRRNPRIRTAFVSTNSISQGVHAAVLWKPLIERFGMEIDFARQSFRWENEARGAATVHCVNVGFSSRANHIPKTLFSEDGTVTTPGNINPYLEDAPNYFIFSRRAPICPAPRMQSGNKPIDNGNYLFTREEMEAFIVSEPQSERWFRPWYGSDEFIYKSPRYCLFLQNCPPNELRLMPRALQKIEAVRQYRRRSPSAGTVRLADRPLRFHVEAFPVGQYLLVPEVSSEGRAYIPMGFMPTEVLCSNLAMLIPGATLYHFGVLTSSLHMAWMRAVCGRLEMRYRYSIEIVYNNFPWPEPTDAQRRAIERAAQRILDARALFADCTYADLYDQNAMPDALKQAHNSLDRAVKAAYGIAATASENECALRLFARYQEIMDRIEAAEQE